MGYITKYGGFWGMLPQTAGRIFWVADADSYQVEGRTYSSSDNNDGLSPERALRTIDYAVGLCTANEGDVIVLLHGSHSVSATVNVDVAGITITGMPGAGDTPRNRSSSGAARNRTQIVSTETAGIVFTVTAADVEIAYIHFDDVSAGQNISVSNAADRFYLHDCTFLMDTASATATMCVTFPLGTGTTTNNDDSLIRNCFFISGSNTGPYIRAAGTVLGLRIESCTFQHQGASALDDALEFTLVGDEGIQIRDCDFLQRTAGTVMTDCIEMANLTTDGVVTILRCYFPVGSDAIEPGNVADVQVAENYLMQGAASVGGTLILST